MPAPDPHLTPREREVLQHIIYGLTTPEIAREMGVEKNTVSTHVRNMFTKFGVRTRAHLVARATATVKEIPRND